MHLKEMKFYMDGKTPMVSIKHVLDSGITELIDTPIGNTDVTGSQVTELAKRIANQVKEDVKWHVQ